METDATTAATFTNVANWQGVDDEPIKDSLNLVESGGTFLQILDAKTQFNKITLDGAGSSFVNVELKNTFIKGHEYRLSILNPDWEKPTTTDSQLIFAVILYNDTTEVHRYIAIKKNGVVPNGFEFIMKYDRNEYTHLSVGGRCVEGDSINILFKDVTEEHDILNSTYPYLAKSYISYEPTAVQGSMSTSGVVNSGSTSYSIVRPIILHPRQRIRLNNGSTTYYAAGVAVIFLTDSEGNYISTLLSRENSILTSGNTGRASFINASDEDIYIGICTANNDVNYIIDTPEEAAPKTSTENHLNELDNRVQTIENLPSVQELRGSRWQRPLGKNDFDYKARLTSEGVESSVGTNYKYIYEVNDRVHVSALINEQYVMRIALFSSFASAKADSSSGRIEYIGGNTSSDNPASSYFRYGDTNASKGYLSVIVYRSDDAVISDADIQTIESSLILTISPFIDYYNINRLNRNIDILDNKAVGIDSFEMYLCDISSKTSGDKTRLKFFYQNNTFEKNLYIDISSALQSVPNIGYGAAVYKTLSGAKRSTTADIAQLIMTAWVTSSVTDIVTAEGVLSIFFKKNDDSEFTYNEAIAIQNALTVSISKHEETESNKDYEELPLGSFTNNSTTVVEQSYISCVPYLGIKYRFVLPSSIKARLLYGNTSSVSNSSTWAVNGESIEIPETEMIQKLQFCNTDGSNLSASDITNMVSSKLIKVLYDELDSPIDKRNYENEKYVKSAIYRLHWNSSAELDEYGGVPSMATIVHVSDLHGDVKRFENAVRYANIIGADAITASGDNVLVSYNNGILYMKDVLAKYSNIPFLNCIGNHEVAPKNTAECDNAYLFNNDISPFVLQGQYKSSDGVDATMPYYYVDLPSKIRMITLNQFDNGCYFGENKGGRLGQTQVTWFCNTLLSVPEGYGVIVVMHSNEAKINTSSELSSWNQTVDWDGRDEDTYGYCVNGLYVNSIRPIRTIIDAFISKEALSTSYKENTVNGNNGETVTINADFSNVANGVEFICYITGHKHTDNIGYVDGAINRQLILDVTCSNCHYPRVSGLSFSEGCDIPRGDRGATQDAFNVYGIDRQNGRVKIARVGSNVNFEGIERKFLLAPYKYARYKVSNNLSYLTSSNDDVYVFSNTESGTCSYSTVLVAATGYILPLTITIQMGSTTLIVGTDYNYNSTTGEINIPNVTDVLTISGTGTSI